MRVPDCSSSFPLLLLALVGQLRTVAAHKLLDASCRADELLLPSIKRVAECTDVDVDDRILDAVDNLGLLGGVGGNAGPLVLAVDEQNRISSRMDSCFHVAA